MHLPRLTLSSALSQKWPGVRLSRRRSARCWTRFRACASPHQTRLKHLQTTPLAWCGTVCRVCVPSRTKMTRASRLLLPGATTRRHIHAGARCSCVWRRTVGACLATAAAEQPTHHACSQRRAASATREPARRDSGGSRRRGRYAIAASAAEVRASRAVRYTRSFRDVSWTGQVSRQRVKSRATRNFVLGFQARNRRMLTQRRRLRLRLPRCVPRAACQLRSLTASVSPRFRGRQRPSRLVSLRRHCSLQLARSGARYTPSERRKHSLLARYHWTRQREQLAV